MSTHQSKHNPSQVEPQSSKPGNSLPPKAQHSTDNRKPLPFDDENPTSGEVVETTKPNIEGFEG